MGSASLLPFTPMFQGDRVSATDEAAPRPDIGYLAQPDVLLMLERFIEFVNEHDGVEWVPMVEIEKDFRKRTPVPEGARMPKEL